MAPHSSTIAWKIPWTEEPGRLKSMGSLRVGHNWMTSLSLFTFMHWKRKWQPTPVFLPGESQGLGSLVGCHLRGRTESDTTEVPLQQQQAGHSFFPTNNCLLISWLQSPSAVVLEPKWSLSLFPLFPHLFAMKWWDQRSWSYFSECWVLSQLFNLLFHFHQEAL